jgi:hypothetical protein
MYGNNFEMVIDLFERFFTLLGHTSIWVTSVGDDQILCGAEHIPCRWFDVAIDHLTPHVFI